MALDEARAARSRWWAVALAVALVGGLAYAAYRQGLGAARIVLVSIAPEAGAEVWSRTPEVVLRFRGPVTAEAVQAGVRFEPAVSGQWVAEEGARVWRFVPARPGWPRGAKVVVHVGPPVQSSTRAHAFRIRPVLLAYLWPYTATRQVYVRDPAAGADARQRPLTQAPHGVVAFAVAPDGQALVYSARNAQGGADLWWLDLPEGPARRVLACGEDLCDQPQFSPDGQVAFVRTPRRGPRRVHVWDPVRDTQQPLPAQGDAYGPLWSPRGWLAYYDQAAAAYVLWSPRAGVVERVPNDIGEHAAWAADGRALYHVELYEVPRSVPDIPDPRLSAHILRYDLETHAQDDLTGAWHWEDATPAADPTGRYLAFGRKNLRAEAWTPGRQLWLFDLTRRAAYPLTDAAAYNHLGFAWAPHGRALAYVRTHQLDLSAAPELWWYDLDANHHERLLEGAYAPQWIP